MRGHITPGEAVRTVALFVECQMANGTSREVATTMAADKYRILPAKAGWCHEQHFGADGTSR